MKVSAKQREQYREAARIFLDISEITTAHLSSKVACAFIGAYCYALQVPVTVYNISKLPFVGTYKTAKRYCDLMVDAKCDPDFWLAAIGPDKAKPEPAARFRDHDRSGCDFSFADMPHRNSGSVCRLLAAIDRHQLRLMLAVVTGCDV